MRIMVRLETFLGNCLPFFALLLYSYWLLLYYSGKKMILRNFHCIVNSTLGKKHSGERFEVKRALLKAQQCVKTNVTVFTAFPIWHGTLGQVVIIGKGFFLHGMAWHMA